MAHKIEQIEGIGEVYAQKLNAAGIKTTEALLEKELQQQVVPNWPKRLESVGN